LVIFNFSYLGDWIKSPVSCLKFIAEPEDTYGQKEEYDTNDDKRNIAGLGIAGEVPW